MRHAFLSIILVAFVFVPVSNSFAYCDPLLTYHLWDSIPSAGRLDFQIIPSPSDSTPELVHAEQKLLALLDPAVTSENPFAAALQVSQNGRIAGRLTLEVVVLQASMGQGVHVFSEVHNPARVLMAGRLVSPSEDKVLMTFELSASPMSLFLRSDRLDGAVKCAAEEILALLRTVRSKQ